MWLCRKGRKKMADVPIQRWQPPPVTAYCMPTTLQFLPHQDPTSFPNHLCRVCADFADEEMEARRG